MKVGTVVFLKKDIPKVELGTMGICIQDYKTGAQILWENGINDGFDYGSECTEFLEIAGYSEAMSEFVFTNVMILNAQWKNGDFDFIFKNKLFQVYEKGGWFATKVREQL